MSPVRDVVLGYRLASIDFDILSERFGGRVEQHDVDHEIRSIYQLYERQYKVMYSDGVDARFRSEDLHPEDREPGAFHRIETEIANAVRRVYDAGLSITAIYQRTPLSRRKIQESLEKTKPAAHSDSGRAAELACRTRLFSLVDYLSRDLVEIARQDMCQDVDINGVARKFMTFFRAWVKVQRVRVGDDPDSKAVLAALESRVRDTLSEGGLQEQISFYNRIPEYKWPQRQWW